MPASQPNTLHRIARSLLAHLTTRDAVFVAFLGGPLPQFLQYGPKTATHMRRCALHWSMDLEMLHWSDALLDLWAKETIATGLPRVALFTRAQLKGFAHAS